METTNFSKETQTRINDLWKEAYSENKLETSWIWQAETVVKIGDVVCGSYEAACEAAIIYCLKNLI